MDPHQLYELDPEVVVPPGLDLIVGLTGFTDAGSAISQYTEFLLDSLEHRVVAEFDTDSLLDYRSRRPVIYFDQDHLSNYEPPRLALSLVRDELGTEFLLLAGFEPDFRWNGFVAAVMELIERFQVARSTWVHAIPMPVPHTRPIGVTVSGNRAELIESYSVWKPHTQVPSTVLHLLEYRLSAAGHPTAGFVLLIPHYLGDTEFPSSAIAALENINLATGLLLPSEELREDAREFLVKIAEQVQNNAELERLVNTLEERYDSYMESSNVRSGLTDSDGLLPSADEIAAELEKFLARRNTAEDEF